MIILLLLVIVAILLLGAAFVRVAIVRGVLAVLALVVSLPLLIYPLKGLIWLVEHPEWLIGLAAGSLLLAFGIKMREIDGIANEMAALWSMFSEAIENDFTPAERQSVIAIRDTGDAVAFRNACLQYVRAAKKRRGPSKEQRRAMKSSYLRDNPR